MTDEPDPVTQDVLIRAHGGPREARVDVPGGERVGAEPGAASARALGRCRRGPLRTARGRWVPCARLPMRIRFARIRGRSSVGLRRRPWHGAVSSSAGGPRTRGRRALVVGRTAARPRAASMPGVVEGAVAAGGWGLEPAAGACGVCSGGTVTRRAREGRRREPDAHAGGASRPWPPRGRGVGSGSPCRAGFEPRAAGRFSGDADRAGSGAPVDEALVVRSVLRIGVPQRRQVRPDRRGRDGRCRRRALAGSPPGRCLRGRHERSCGRRSPWRRAGGVPAGSSRTGSRRPRDTRLRLVRADPTSDALVGSASPQRARRPRRVGSQSGPAGGPRWPVLARAVECSQDGEPVADGGVLGVAEDRPDLVRGAAAPALVRAVHPPGAVHTAGVSGG